MHNQIMLMSDLHIHSTFSDGQLSIPEIINFYGSRGFKAIAITDHICEERTLMGRAAQFLNYTLRPQNFDHYLDLIAEQGERALREYGMQVLPGFEVSKNSLRNSRSAHILGIGVSRFVSADNEIDEIIKQIREQGALCIAAHPVSTRKFEKQTYHLWDRRDCYRNSFDAWEVASGPHFFGEVAESGLPLLATSDFHRPEHVHSWKTLIDCKSHPEAVLEAVRRQKVEFKFFEGRELCERGNQASQATWHSAAASGSGLRV